MSNFEVPSPILCSPFAEPNAHWWILEGQPAGGGRGGGPPFISIGNQAGRPSSAAGWRLR